MRKAALLAAVWIAVVPVVFVINSVIYEDESPSRPSDGWCDLLALGVPDADDPDCEGWDGRGPAPDGRTTPVRHALV
jgi:hypothetical protein